MPMFEYVPVCALLGVPDSLPVVVLNVGPGGLVGDAERERLALGVLRRRRERVSAARLTDVGGVPEIVGGWFVPRPVVLTVIENGASELAFEPSVTEMMMFDERADLAAGRSCRQASRRRVERQPRRLIHDAEVQRVSARVAAPWAGSCTRTTDRSDGGAPEDLGGVLVRWRPRESRTRAARASLCRRSP
jgi:hypothetical protein